MKPTVYTNGLKLQSVVADEKNENILNFPKGWIAADSSVQRNGTRQDVGTMSIDAYLKNPVFLKDHVQETGHIIGRVLGLRKEGNKLVFSGVEFAPTPQAQEARALILGGFVKDVSTGLLAYTDENGVYKDSELLEISLVVVGNNTKARLNQVTPAHMEPEVIAPEVEEVVVEEVAEIAAEAPAEVPAVETNALESRIVDLEMKLNKAVTPKQTAMRVEEKFDHKLHFVNQVKAQVNRDFSGLSKLNQIAVQAGAVTNALDLTTGAQLLPTAEVMADIYRCSTKYGLLLPEIDVRNRTALAPFTQLLGGTEITYTDSVGFCAVVPGVTPTYTNVTVNPVKAKATTVICEALDLQSPADVYQDVIEQFGRARARFVDAKVVTATTAAAAAVALDETSATTLLKDLVLMQNIACDEATEKVYVMTRQTWTSVKAMMASNTNYRIDSVAQTIEGFRVVVLENGLMPSWTGTGAIPASAILFGGFKSFRWYNMGGVDLKTSTEGVVDGVNLFESDSIGLSSHFYYAAYVLNAGSFTKNS